MADQKISQLPAYTGGTNADVIPLANLTTQATEQVTLAALKTIFQAGLLANTTVSGTLTHTANVTTTTTVTHGLGRTPIRLKFFAIAGYPGANNTTGMCHGVYDSSGQRCVTAWNNTANNGNHSSNAIVFETTNEILTGTVANVGGTTFDITWVQTSGTDAVVWTILWEAF